MADQAKIDTPGVDANADNLAQVSGTGRAEALPNMAPLAQHVPIQSVGGQHGTVVEAINLVELQPSAVEQAGHMAAAGGPHIDRQKGLFAHVASTFKLIKSLCHAKVAANVRSR